MKLKKLIDTILVLSILIYHGEIMAMESYEPQRIDDCISGVLPETYMKISGDENVFSLVDYKDGEAFVVTNNSYGLHSFNTDGKQIFNPKEESSIAYWLNTEFLNNGNDGIRLPEEFDDYYSAHTWNTEPGNSEGAAEEAVFQAKISLMSLDEFLTYKNKIGFSAEFDTTHGESGYWGLRTPSKNNKSYYLAANLTDLGAFVERVASPESKTVVRPVFYLKGKFFSEIKLDTSYMGSDVKKILTGLLNDAQMRAIGYSDSEIAVIKNADESTYERFTVSGLAADGVYEGENVAFNFEFQRVNSSDIIYTAEYVVDGKTVKVEELASVQGKNNYLLKFPDIDEGNHNVCIKFRRDSDKINEFSIDIFSCVGNRKNMAKLNGIGAHFHSRYYTEGDYKLFAASGANAIREGFYWSDVEKHKGVYDWSSLEERFGRFNDMGIEIIASVNVKNKLYTVDDCGTFSNDEEIEAYANMIAEFAKAFPYVHYIIPQNEPNLTTDGTDRQTAMDNYIKMIKVVSKKLHDVRDDICLVGGSLASENNFEKEGSADTNYDTFLNYVVPQIYSYVDAIDIHIYTTPQDCEVTKMYNRLDSFKNKLAECGGWKKIFVTETGWVTGESSVKVSEDRQAYNTVRAMNVISEADYDGTIIYDFKNDGPDIGNQEHNFGLIDYESNPKKSYYALKNYLSEIENYNLIGMKILNDGIRMYLYLNGTSAMAVMWADEETLYDFGDCTLHVRDWEGNEIITDGCVNIGTSTVYVQGMSYSWLKDMISYILKEKIWNLSSVFSEYGVYDIDSNIEQIMGMTDSLNNSDDFCDLITAIYKSSEKFFELYDLEKLNLNELGNLLFEIHKTGERIKYASALYADDSEEISWDEMNKLEMMYWSVKETVAGYTSPELPYSKDIFNYGQTIFDAVFKENKFTSTVGSADKIKYTLSASGELNVSVKADAGSYVSLKINSGNATEYIATGTADFNGVCRFNTRLRGAGKTYTINVYTNDTDSSYTVELNGEETVKFAIPKVAKIQAEYLLRYAKLMLPLGRKDTLTADITWSEVGDDIGVNIQLFNSGNEKSVFVVMAKYVNGVLTQCQTSEKIVNYGLEMMGFNFEKDNNANYSIFVWDGEKKQIPYRFVWNRELKSETK